MKKNNEAIDGTYYKGVAFNSINEKNLVGDEIYFNHTPVNTFECDMKIFFIFIDFSSFSFLFKIH